MADDNNNLHPFAAKLAGKRALAASGDARAQKYLDSGAAQVLRDYLNPDPITGAGGIPASRGGGLGAIRENDPVLSAGSDAAQLARENLLYQPGGGGGQRRTNLTAKDIKGINIPLVREGLSDADYFRFNQMLYSPNIKEYQKARPWGSGKALADIVTMATPAKYLGIAGNFLKDKTLDAGQNILDIPSNIMGSTMVEQIGDTWKKRKKGRGIAGFVEDILTTVGIGNTKKTNEFIEKQNDVLQYIPSNIQDDSPAGSNEWIIKKSSIQDDSPAGSNERIIKKDDDDEKKEIDTDIELIKNKKRLHYPLLKGGQPTTHKSLTEIINDPKIYSYIIETAKQQEELENYKARQLEANKNKLNLQSKKKGGIVSLYQGGPLDRRVNALSVGLGGLLGTDNV